MKRLLLSFWLLCLAGLAFAQSSALPDFADLAEKQGPVVVNISTTQIIRGNRLGMPQFPFDEDDPAFELFKRFIPRHPQVPRDFENKSLGSGFVISADGYILTNAHVVDGADEVVVKLTDKREFKAKVIGSDKRTDVALIKIEASGLPVARLGDTTRLRVGEWVAAIGSPFGFENTVTAGIVSAKGRSLPQENYVPFIQTDVAINPGNSGGPLFNMKGEVIGINSQIFSRSGGYQGIAFAIPIDVAMDVQAQLKSGGKVSRGRLGVTIQEVSKELAESFGLTKPGGALVTAVEKGSPAEKAGIETGDVILKFEGKVVNSSGDLPRMVGSTKPGTRSTVQVWRKGATRDITISVGEMSEEKLAGKAPRGKGGKATEPAVSNKLGLVLSEPSAEQRKQLGVSHGLVVEDVRNGGARTDLRPGDVILALVSKGVHTEINAVEQFNGLLAKFDKNSTITLLVRRGEAQTFITIKGVGDK
ncbi:DegQ family serine endoprotease [Sulfurisoma sediminicola]|uniref:Probable periplasmic serine endoprotease DegP-like n=1 Tax=Sulfurisoma sediminicola TaxID=1381557 RepID=A0A497XE36_9PROT|nr:DegQ family serine endoprotease [Sulfurisoma sediminicola]RLJ64974.1 serine protease Do [Sulfurisoma sediminicola]